MQFWTKNGSIPRTETDGTEGWKLAPAPPQDVPAGKELLWLNLEWIVRDPKPADRDGYQWNWQHSTRSWVESVWIPIKFAEPIESEGLIDPALLPEDMVVDMLTTDQIVNLATAQIV